MKNDVENYEDSKAYVSICHEVNPKKKSVLYYSIDC